MFKPENVAQEKKTTAQQSPISLPPFFQQALQLPPPLHPPYFSKKPSHQHRLSLGLAQSIPFHCRVACSKLSVV